MEAGSREWRYGDFPELFWDAKPDARIDIQNSVTLARLLTGGRADVIGALVPLDVLHEQLDTLPLPEHTRLFWRVVLYGPPRSWHEPR